MSALRPYADPLALLAGVTAVKLACAATLGLSEDEAYYWVWGQHLAAGYFDHPPAIAWLIRGGTALLGNTELGVRLLPILGGFIGAALLLPLARDRMLLAAMLAFFPLYALGGVLATPDAPLILSWAGALAAAAAGAWPLVGLACGLAMLSKYTGVLLLPLLVAAEPGALRTRGPWLAAGLAFLVYLPNALWNIDHSEISWHFQIDHVARAADRLGFFLAQVGLAGPLLFGAFAAWWAVGWRGDRVERLAWWSSLPLLVLATGIGGEANWAAPAFLGAAVGLSRRAGGFARAAWAGAGMAGLISAVVLIHAQRPLVDLPSDPLDRLAGGRTLAESVSAWGIPDVYTSRYQEAALIQFYSGIPARTLPDSGRPNQYDLWPAPLADHALFVRPWRASTTMAMTKLGYDSPGPNAVSAYVNTTDPTTPRLIARWQVYEVRRIAPRSGASGL